jgi:nucleotide sugar dehydrogenase
MGLPLACTFAKHGAEVVVCDVNSDLVAAVEEGNCPYEEPGLPELMSELRRSGRLRATTVTTEGVSHCDAIVIIVPAHLTPERDIDFSILRAASADVGRGLSRGALVVYETTVSVGGTRRQLIPVLEQHSGLKAGKDFFVAYSPERVKANLVLKRLECTPKVLGGLDAESIERARILYGQYLRAPIDEVGTIEAAEMTKLLGMLYRDVNIALANELAAFCELANVSFDRVRAAANSDGEANLLLPGIGVGGHCTPVYPYFLTRESRRLGMTQRISEAAREINDDQPARQLDRLATHWRALAGVRAHILGLGFRPGVKVDTYSPAYTLLDELAKRGALVTIEDPYYSDEDLARAGFMPGNVSSAQLVILNTAHEQFGSPAFGEWKARGTVVVLDGRNFWQQAEAESFGLLYFGVGRASLPERTLALSRTDAAPPSPGGAAKVRRTPGQA